MLFRVGERFPFIHGISVYRYISLSFTSILPRLEDALITFNV